MGVKTKDQTRARCLIYVAQVSRNAEVWSQFDIVRKSLAESVFVPYFQIGPYINGMKDWCDRPFDVDGIYEQTIFPELRLEKSLRLLDCLEGPHSERNPPRQHRAKRARQLTNSTTSACRPCSGTAPKTR